MVSCHLQSVETNLTKKKYLAFYETVGSAILKLGTPVSRNAMRLLLQSDLGCKFVAVWAVLGNRVPSQQAPHFADRTSCSSQLSTSAPVLVLARRGPGVVGQLLVAALPFPAALATTVALWLPTLPA